MTENFVEVHWAWLVCLITQVLLTAMFLFGVIAQTAYLKVKVLKNSSLATLFAVPSEIKAYMEEDGGVPLEANHVMAQRMNNVTGKFGMVEERGWVLGLGTKGPR